MSGPYISHFRVHADITIACLRFLLTCSPLISAVVSGANTDHIIKGFYDFFPYVHEFWPDHLLNYSKALLAHPGEQKRIKAVQDLLCMLSSYQTYSAQNVLNPSPDGAVVEDNSIDGESSVLDDFPPAVRKYITHRKKTPVRQASSMNGTDSSLDLPQTDLNWISAAYRTFQTQFESLLSAANSLNYHQMRAQYCQMTATSDNVHQFKFRHSKSAFLCRWSGCIWASAGFQSIAEREKHEIIMHTRRFRCCDPNCDLAQNGFSSRHALKKHTLKDHTPIEDLVLPAFPISKSRSEKKSKDWNVSADVQGQNELKISQVSRFLRVQPNEDELFDYDSPPRGPFDELDKDASENFDFDAFLETNSGGGFQFEPWENLSHETQMKATFDGSDINTLTQGQAEEKAHSPNSYTANAKLVLPEPSPEQIPRALSRGNQAFPDEIRVRIRTFYCFVVVQIQLNQMIGDTAFDRRASTQRC